VFTFGSAFWVSGSAFDVLVRLKPDATYVMRDVHHRTTTANPELRTSNGT